MTDNYYREARAEQTSLGRNIRSGSGNFRNGFKEVTLVNANANISWRHQLSDLLKGSNEELIAGNQNSLEELNVHDDVKLLMEEKAPSLNFSYGMSSPIAETLDAILPRKAQAVIKGLTVAADAASTFANNDNEGENDAASVFNPWTKSVPAWNQRLDPLKFSYTFNFKLGQSKLWNAKQEVFLPIINLLAPVLPRNISYWFTKGPIPGKTELLADSIVGALRAGFNAEGGRKLAENVFNAVKSYTYNIDFGKTVAFSNCLINGAKPSFSSDTDEEGYPIAGSIELSFTTIAPFGLTSVSNAQAVRFGGRG